MYKLIQYSLRNSTMKRIVTSGLMAVALLFGTIACNQSTDSVDQTQDANEQRFEDTAMEEDRDDASEFMTQAASSGMMEIEGGKLAQQQATNAQVKEFGAMMVKDHTAASQELKTLASSKNLMLPDSMSNDHMDHVQGLREKTGAEFDRAYMDHMVDMHDKDISMFENVTEDENYPDMEVKAFAAKQLPILRQHRERAQQIRDGLR